MKIFGRRTEIENLQLIVLDALKYKNCHLLYNCNKCSWYQDLHEAIKIREELKNA